MLHDVDRWGFQVRQPATSSVPLESAIASGFARPLQFNWHQALRFGYGVSRMRASLHRRRSGLLLVLCTLLASGAAYWLLSRQQGIWFTDVSTQAGLTIVTDNRAQGGYRMIEAMGTGLALIDYDSDGWLDIAVGQGGDLPGDVGPGGRSCFLYRNNRDGTFTDVSEQAGLDFTVFTQGMAVGDFDGDGHDDLFIAGFERSVLYRNTGKGAFEDVTQTAGVAGAGWASSCAFADLSGDGYLDLYVVRYLANTIDEAGQPTVLCPTNQPTMPPYAYCPPTAHSPEGDLIYRNNGDGTFTEVSELSAIAAAPAPGLGVLIADLDGDRLLDIFVANDMQPNQLWKNLGGFEFEDIAKLAGVAYGDDGQAKAGMGIAAGDYTGDGLLDIWVTNFYNELNSLFRQRHPGVFEFATSHAGLEEPSWKMLGFGTGFLDADNNGQLDLFVANGVLNDYSSIGRPYEQPAQLFRNTGDARFEDISASCGKYFRGKWLGRAVALGDLNNDGATDLVVSHLGRHPALLRNDTQPRGQFLGLQLTGAGGSRSPVGAVVRVSVAGRTIQRSLVAGTSYLASHDPRLLIGLGEVSSVENVHIRWPSGTEQDFGTLEGGAYYRIVEGGQPERLELTD